MAPSDGAPPPSESSSDPNGSARARAAARAAHDVGSRPSSSLTHPSSPPQPRRDRAGTSPTTMTGAAVAARIPVMDLKRSCRPRLDGGDLLDNGDSEESLRLLAVELVEALETYGFATLVNHGISKESIQSAFDASRTFFALDTTAKQKYSYRGHDANTGYIGVGQESHENNHGSADVKETFDVGPEPIDDDTSGSGGAGGGTPWPSEEGDLGPQQFRATLVTYFEECNRLHLRLLRLIAVGLGLPTAGVFVEQCDERHCNLRLLRYPCLRVRPTSSDNTNCEKPDDEEEERVVVRGARHTDFGTLTLLAQDDVGGLRVQPRAATIDSSVGAASTEHAPWIHVAPVEGSLVLNVGDMLQRWTNGRLVATPHQVVSVLPPPSTKEDDGNEFVVIPERYSIAFFCNANKGTVLRPIPCLVKAHEKPKYEEVTAHEYLTRRLAETIRPAA